MQSLHDSVSLLYGKSVLQCHNVLPTVSYQVLHPGIRRQVQLDLILMKAGSVLISCLPGFKWLSLPEVVDEFEKLMMKQVVLTFIRYSCKLLQITPLFIYLFIAI